MRPAGVPGLWLVRMASRLVPFVRRHEWLAEWEAELTHAWGSARASSSPWAGRVRLNRHALGALVDAIAVGRQNGAYGMMDTELKQAIRLLVRRPRFMAAVVVTLALGIGGAAAVYTLIDRLMLRPPPFAEAHRLVELHTTFGPDLTVPMVEAEAIGEWARQDMLFDAVEAHSSWQRVLSGAGEPASLQVASVTPGLLPLLGARPLFGRLPEGHGADSDEIVIAESMWRGVLGSDEGVLGRRLTFNDRAYTVVGVLPDEFRYPAREPQAWVIARAGEEGMLQVEAVGRVRQGLTREQAEALTADLGARFQEQRQAGGMPWTVRLHWVADQHLQPELRRALWLLAGAVLLVLLIAGVNAANLLLVDAARRSSELSIRTALGATRAGLVRQLVLESMLLAVLSAAAGLLVAYWMISVLLGLLPQEILLQAFHRIRIDGDVVAFTVVLSLLVAVLYSFWPAVAAARSAGIIHTNRSTGGRATRYTRSSLVVAEVALSVMLVTAAGLLLNSFVRLTRAELGFEPQGLLAFNVPPRADGETFMEDLHARLSEIPGVVNLARADAAPSVTSTNYQRYILQPDHMEDTDPELITGTLPVFQIDSAYLRVIGVSLTRGRGLLPEDVDSRGVLINEALARRLWPDGAAVDRRFRVMKRPDAWVQVVGVVENAKLLGPAADDVPYFIMQHAPPDRRGSWFVLRTHGSEAAVIAAARSVIRQLDAGLPLPEITPVATSMRNTFAERRFFMLLIGSFALVSTILAVVGLYGVVSHTVSQRTREIGIRMALGARASAVERQVLGSGAKLVLAGIALGMAGAFATTQLLNNLLFNVDARDVPTFALVALGVAGIALLATLLPARRAARVDPLVALRAD